ncbi:DoxX family protein [Streptantibioticus ferralitis]|uniref:DoxX family protein n=1 Tax=Streptantibioticus ferralitis TaxID=236510 RepID=A0ABT5YZ38_9ACTN|nr:DoxX family protein [Streptantibioticus ferralitis]MDF2256805.1 DoxX family protein [Streptantibioticus ferralitis]
MNITLWIIASVLAIAFFAAGLMKIAQPREKLAASGMAWAGDFSPGAIKAIGAVEILGALGLILPAALNVAPVLVAWAAVGLAVVMLSAAVVHARRKENQAVPVNVVLLVPAVLVAWGRFGPHSF